MLQIWDTDSQERYHSVFHLLYRDPNVAVVCFKARSQESIESIPSWIEKVNWEVSDCDDFLVGTKGAEPRGSASEGCFRLGKGTGEVCAEERSHHFREEVKGPQGGR